MNAPVPQPQEKAPLTDVQTLRESARRHIEEGAVTEHYKADREKVLQLLNEALATEVVCVLRYRHDYFVARGLKAKVAAAEFLQHANQELEHADAISERIVQLGGEPDLNPDTLSRRSHAEYRLGVASDDGGKARSNKRGVPGGVHFLITHFLCAVEQGVHKREQVRGGDRWLVQADGRQSSF